MLVLSLPAPFRYNFVFVFVFCLLSFKVFPFVLVASFCIVGGVRQVSYACESFEEVSSDSQIGRDGFNYQEVFKLAQIYFLRFDW